MPAIRHTPLFHAHERAGASFAEQHGWQVPAYFTFAQKEAEQLSNSAALGDVSWMTKLDLKGFGLKTPPAIHDGRAWHFGQEHYLATCNPAARDSVLAQLKSFSASPDLSLPPPVYVTDVTSVYAQFLLAGPRSRDILRKLTSLNVSALQNFGCGQASLGHVHSSVLRDDLPGGISAFHILISREYAESVWESILHAGHEFHLAPFGVKALEFLGGAA
jgi:glycine cleavage system aminomethyltransferase T